ncbi:MAG TPA: ABC transporter ATP-binding protein [Candidatus Limnocylindrales bacterium]|nr:ABC transporter ATP-binding protein [Candidatus Limnocylindrales bacterium]
MSVIELRGLTKHYGGGRFPPHFPPWRRRERVRALTDLDLSVQQGEVFGFLGPNGAGKTTTIRLLLGFLHPSRGSGRVLGHDIRADSLAIRAATGYLPGGIALYDTLSGEQVLDYLARLYRRPTPLRAELVERLEMTRRTLRRPVRDYSRGMRQKIGIIQALQHDPELAILDEPTEGLDPLMQNAFYDLLEARRGSGRTIFFSSHVLSEVERVCDRVAIIRGGELVALSDITELLARRQRRVEMRFEGPPPRLDGVAGVSAIQLRDSLLTCRLEGDVGQFVAALRDVRVVDLTIEPARLEEAFLEFYADQAEVAGNGADDGDEPPAEPSLAAEVRS